MIGDVYRGPKRPGRKFNTFPQAVQEQTKLALDVAAAGEMADVEKSMKGFDAGVFELAIAHRGDRLPRGLRVEAWGMRSGSRIRPRRNRARESRRRSTRLDMIHDRIRRIREMLK